MIPRGPWGHPVIAAAAAISTVIAGGVLGAALAEPRPAEQPRTVTAGIAQAWSSAEVPDVPTVEREVVLGVTGDAIRANASELLTAIASRLDVRAAIAELLPEYGRSGTDDACATAGATSCPPGVAGSVVTAAAATEGSPTTPVAPASGRPPTEIYSVTPDLVAVTVSHRPGESVAVYPNVPSGSDEPHCDPIVIGYDALAHPLATVSTTLDPDVLEAAGFSREFGARTTISFDVDEGLTFFLCAEVTTADGALDYRAESIVQTADRLQAAVSLISLSAQPLGQWSLRGYLPSGQHCGTWRSTEFDGTESPSPARLLCDYGDRRVGPAGAPGRGVLPWSSGDPDYFTVELRSPVVEPVFTAIDLGAAARCTGTCTTPADAYYRVGDARASAIVRVHWSQGDSNGAVATAVGPVTDSESASTTGPLLDVGLSALQRPALDRAARSATATLAFRADEPASYVARLVPVDGCTRPGAVLEFHGQLGTAERWTAMERVTFAGLCAGSDYQAVVELTAASGERTTWGEDEWGTRSAVHVDELIIPIDITWVVESDPIFEDYTEHAGFLTLRADDEVLVDHEGGCFPSSPSIGGDLTVGQLRLGEVTRFSGVISGAAADPAADGCSPLLVGGLPGLTFAFDLSLEALAAHPDGLLVRIEPAPGSAPSAHAPVSGILRITAFL